MGSLHPFVWFFVSLYHYLCIFIFVSFQLLPRWWIGFGLWWPGRGFGPSESSTGPGWWKWKAVHFSIFETCPFQHRHFYRVPPYLFHIWLDRKSDKSQYYNNKSNYETSRLVNLNSKWFKPLLMQVTFAKRSSGSRVNSTFSPFLLFFLFHMLLQTRLWYFLERYL